MIFLIARRNYVFLRKESFYESRTKKGFGVLVVPDWGAGSITSF
jgi:hypothetical protein